MAFNFKNTVFSYFSRYEKDKDPNKDSDDKGTLERFNEMLGEDWDRNLLPLVNGILDNTLVPETVLDKFIPYLENMIGLEPIVSDLTIRRKFLKNAIPIFKVKGTLRSYEIVFRLLGFDSVTIEALAFRQGFDSPVTFDDDSRRFDDTQCQPCSYYNLKLSGFVEMTGEIYDMIIKAVQFVEPINAKLFSVIYNKSELSFAIFVADNGDLIYEPLSGDRTDFRLSANGDLYVIGANASAYRLNANGDLTKY